VCTVSIVPLGDGFRLRCNRDERRDRPMARPPALHRLQHRTAIFPVDPASQGTWVGVNDVGLAAAILNRTAESMPASDGEPRASRGQIVPALLACASTDEALDRCADFDLRAFDRFRLLIVHRAMVVIVTSDRRALSHEVVNLSQPVMQTSSSLGDRVVEGPRRRLFDRLLGQPHNTLRAQRRFHHYHWRSRPDISVLMERADARTVSHTVIDVRRLAITMTYQAIGSR
jgi:uncharacterized protein with NRDE domain